jgi:hypothetical protein
VVEWAKNNNYGLKCGLIGNKKYGCVLGAVVMMHYPTAMDDAKQFADSYQSDYNVFTSAIYGKYASPNDRRPIYEGFDNLCDGSSPLFNFGKAVRKLAIMQNEYKLSPELRQAIHAAFENLPAPEEVIQWAKANNFKFQQANIGNKNCGCALTAVALMRCPQILDGICIPDEAILVMYGHDISDPVKKNKILARRRGIWCGFDHKNVYTSDPNNFAFGATVRELAIENNLFIKES